jgi:putative addiction module killer protein
MIEIVEYLDSSEHSPFGEWFDGLDAKAAAKVTTALVRMQQGNAGDIKPVGSGVSERRIDYGPGYRIYFAKDGEKLVILLAGGSKKGQQKDIENAIKRWQDYKQRRK